jgi:hypothetical protein
VKKEKKPGIMSVYDDKELAETAKAGVIEIAVALFDFDARSDAELSFKKEQYIEILKKTDTVGWWKGRLRGTSNSGLFPSNYAKVIYGITEKDAVRTAEGSIKMTPEQQKAFVAAAAQKKRMGDTDGSGSESGAGGHVSGAPCAPVLPLILVGVWVCVFVGYHSNGLVRFQSAQTRGDID